MTKKRHKHPNGSVTQQNSAFSITPELRHQMIEEAAYYRALHRGLNGGDPIMDWLEAERDIDQAILNVEHGNVEAMAGTNPAWQLLEQFDSSSPQQRK